MHSEIKKLFIGKKKITVNHFINKIDGLSPEKREEYFRMVYRSALAQMDSIPQRYQEFCIDLINRDRARFDRFCAEYTVLGRLRFPLCDPLLFIRITTLAEEKKANKDSSYTDLALCINLSFQTDLAYKEVYKLLLTPQWTTDELVELLGKVKID